MKAIFKRDGGQLVHGELESTRLGRQELNAELLDDVPGALWNRTRLEELRWPDKAVPDLARIVIAIDPAVTSGEDADETGMIVAGRDAAGRGYVLADRSGHYTPGFRSDDFAARGVHGGIRDIRINHSQSGLDHVAAVIDFGDDAVGLVLAIERNRELRPFGRRVMPRTVGEDITTATAQTPSGPAAQDFSSCRGGFPSGRTARRGGGGIGAWYRAVGPETATLLAKIFR